MIPEEYKPFIDDASDNWAYEEEYAGRMETYCRFCGSYQEHPFNPNYPEVHKPGCLHLKAVELLAQKG